MKQEIFNQIIDLQNISNNKCGTSVVYLSTFFEINTENLHKILNELHNEKKIRVRQGINHKLIFLKK